MVQFLLKKNADQNQQDSKGITPYMKALFRKNSSIELENAKEIVQAFEQYELDKTLKDNGDHSIEDYSDKQMRNELRKFFCS